MTTKKSFKKFQKKLDTPDQSRIILIIEGKHRNEREPKMFKIIATIIIAKIIPWATDDTHLGMESFKA